MGIETVNLPDLGEGVTEGELVNWLVKPGDTVESDQIIAEIMTDKATIEVPTVVSGVVKELVPNLGDMIPIETALITVETTGASSSKKTKEAPKKVDAPVAAVTSNGAAVTTSGGVNPPVAGHDVLASPSTRRLARELLVDVNTIQGSGPAGRITRENVLNAKGGTGAVSGGMPAYAPPPKIALEPRSGDLEERIPLRGIRRKIAKAMQQAKQIIPHFTIMDEANVTELVKLRTLLKERAGQQGVKITYLPLVMKALIATCREYPMLNASIDDANEEIVYKKFFNVGFAADTPNGLMVPVIKDADRKSVLEISQEISELALKARDGKLTREDMSDATITITNIGSIGGNYATPIINHPEVAIFGMYKIVDKPVMIKGKFRAQKVMNFTCTADHRLIDGAVAANFLNTFIKKIETLDFLTADAVLNFR